MKITVAFVAIALAFSHFTMAQIVLGPTISGVF
jgi:hypothetical protein